jgi:hypothetical protein
MVQVDHSIEGEGKSVRIGYMSDRQRQGVRAGGVDHDLVLCGCVRLYETFDRGAYKGCHLFLSLSLSTTFAAIIARSGRSLLGESQSVSQSGSFSSLK